MRAMTYATFERKYKPKLTTYLDGEHVDRFDLTQVEACDPELIWTMLDCDGVLYLAAGIHWVNRTGDYIVCEVKHEFTDRPVKW